MNNTESFIDTGLCNACHISTAGPTAYHSLLSEPVLRDHLSEETFGLFQGWSHNTGLTGLTLTEMAEDPVLPAC